MGGVFKRFIRLAGILLPAANTLLAEIAPVLDIGDAAAEAVVKRRTDLAGFESWIS